MNASLIAIYMSPGLPLRLSFLEELVRTGGYQLQNPQNGGITFIDEMGDFHTIQAHFLTTRLSQREDTRFQFWEVAWEGKYPGDLYCRVIFKTGSIVIEFGELPRGSDLLVKGILDISQGLLDDEQIIGLVIDRPGITEEYADWYGFFVEGEAYDGTCPDLLCLRKGMEGLLPVSCRGYLKSSRVHHTVVYDGQMAQLLGEEQ
jgi:hypothetical protein